MELKDFKELKVWVKAHALTLAIYRSTRAFPKEELYGLTSQLRRAASSIAANLAEGCGRRSDGELNRFVQIGRGSASELEYHLLLARDLNLLSLPEFKKLDVQINEVQRMLTALAKSLQPPSQPAEQHRVRAAAAASIGGNQSRPNTSG